MKIAILFDGASAFAESPDQDILGTVEAVGVSLTRAAGTLPLVADAPLERLLAVVEPIAAALEDGGR